MNRLERLLRFFLRTGEIVAEESEINELFDETNEKYENESEFLQENFPINTKLSMDFTSYTTDPDAVFNFNYTINSTIGINS